MLFALLLYVTSCSNPEDKATGNPDSTSFNKGGTDKNLNTPAPELGNQAEGASDSISAASKNKATSPAEETNRSYKAGGDSTKK